MVGISTTIVAGIAMIGWAGSRLMPDPDPRLAALGRALRKARRDRDLSQEAVGQRAGMHPNHVGTIERGTKDLRATTLLRLIEALEMSPAELFADYRLPDEPAAEAPSARDR
jgi:transcriptional regulator with XRE-family HTH domain